MRDLSRLTCRNARHQGAGPDQGACHPSRGIRSLTSKLCSVSPSGTGSRIQPKSPVPPKHIRTLQCARRRVNDQSQDLRLVSLGARQNTSSRSRRWSEQSGGSDPVCPNSNRRLAFTNSEALGSQWKSRLDRSGKAAGSRARERAGRRARSTPSANPARGGLLRRKKPTSRQLGLASSPKLRRHGFRQILI